MRPLQPGDTVRHVGDRENTLAVVMSTNEEGVWVRYADTPLDAMQFPVPAGKLERVWPLGIADTGGRLLRNHRGHFEVLDEHGFTVSTHDTLQAACAELGDQRR